MRVNPASAMSESPLPLSVDAVCDGLPLGTIILDQSLQVHYWNKWMQDKTGITADKAKGRDLRDLFPDMKNFRLQSAVKQAINSGMAQSISRALHNHVIPIPSSYGRRHGIPLMQQEITVTPVDTGQGQVLALISLRDVTERAVRESALAAIIQRLKQESTRDPLTSAFNQRFMWEWIEVQLKRCTRDGLPLACLMADIDYFKDFNDTHGHQAGDRVLQEFTRRLGLRLRQSDVVVRYGGEEFVILLPGCTSAKALETGEAVRRHIAEEPFDLPSVGPLHIQCSIGISVWEPDQPCTAEDLIRRADKLLYRAKRAGRNRVITEDSEPFGNPKVP